MSDMDDVRVNILCTRSWSTTLLDPVFLADHLTSDMRLWPQHCEDYEEEEDEDDIDSCKDDGEED